MQKMIFQRKQPIGRVRPIGWNAAFFSALRSASQRLLQADLGNNFTEQLAVEVIAGL